MTKSFQNKTRPAPYHDLIPSDKQSIEATKNVVEAFRALNERKWTPNEIILLNEFSTIAQEKLRAKRDNPNHAQGRFLDLFFDSTVFDNASDKIAQTIKETGVETAKTVASSVEVMQKTLLQFFVDSKLFSPSAIESFLCFAIPFVTMYFSNFDPVVVTLQITQLMLTFSSFIKCAQSLLQPAIMTLLQDFAAWFSQITDLNWINPFKTSPSFDKNDTTDISKNSPSPPSSTIEPVTNTCQMDVPVAFDSHKMVQHLVTALSLAFTGVASTVVVSQDSKIKTICDMARVATSLSSLYKVISELADWCVKKIYEFFGFNMDDIKISSMVPEFQEFANEVISLDTTETRTDMTTDSSVCTRIERCYVRAVELSKDIYKPHFPPHITTRYTMLYNIIKTLYMKSLDCAPRFKDARPEPACIIIAGPSNIGKSVITREILTILRTTLFPDVQEKEFAYYHNSGCAFYDGYVKQKALVKDDMYQMVDTQGSPNTDFIDTIRLVNTAPALLPMAVAELKKDAWFASEFVLASTNVSSIKPVSIVSAEAVTRRLHLWVEPILHCKSTRPFSTDLVWGKYRQFAHHDGHSMACYTFHLKYKGDTTYTPQPKSSANALAKRFPDDPKRDPFAWTFEDIMLKLLEVRLLHIRNYDKPSFTNVDHTLISKAAALSYEELANFNNARAMPFTLTSPPYVPKIISSSSPPPSEKTEEEEPTNDPDITNHSQMNTDKKTKTTTSKKLQFTPLEKTSDISVPCGWVDEGDNIFLFNPAFFFSFPPESVFGFISSYPELFSNQFCDSIFTKTPNIDMLSYLKSINHSIFSPNFYAHLSQIRDDVKFSRYLPYYLGPMVDVLLTQTRYYSRTEKFPEAKLIYVDIVPSMIDPQISHEKKLKKERKAEKKRQKKYDDDSGFTQWEEDNSLSPAALEAWQKKLSLKDNNHAQMEQYPYDTDSKLEDDEESDDEISLPTAKLSKEMFLTVEDSASLLDLFVFGLKDQDADQVIAVNDRTDRYFFHKSKTFLEANVLQLELRPRVNTIFYDNLKTQGRRLLNTHNFKQSIRLYLRNVLFDVPNEQYSEGMITATSKVYHIMTMFFDNIDFIVNKPPTPPPTTITTSSISKSFTSALASYAASFLDTLRSHWFYIPASLLLASIAIYKIYFYVFPSRPSIASEAGIDVYDNKLKKTFRMDPESAREKFLYGGKRWEKANIKLKRQNNKNTTPDVAAEGSRDSTADQICASVNNNLFLMEFHKNGKRIGSIHILFVKGTTAIAPRHLVTTLSESDHVMLAHPYNESRAVDVDKIIVLIDDTIPFDVCALQFPGAVGSRRNIIGCFASDHDIFNKDISNQARLLSINTSLSKIPSWQSRELYASYDATPVKYRDVKGINIITNPSNFSYNQSTETGMCGSPLVILNTSFARKVVGYHIAGNDSGTKGYSTPITQETIHQLLSHPNAVKTLQIAIEDYEKVIPFNGLEDSVIPGAKNINLLGIVSVDEATTACSATKLRKTELYGAFGPSTKEPAILRPVRIDGQYVDPLEKALLANTNQVPLLDDSIIDLIVDKLSSHFRENIRPDTVRRVLTQEEAINGIPGKAFIDSLNFGTSPGYPFTLYAHDKRAFFDPVGNKPIEFLQERIDTIIERAKDGEACLNIFTDSNKDEKRPIAKVAEASTRHISGSPVDFTIVLRMYTLAFMAHVMDNRVDNHVAVGINPTSQEWSRLAWKLQSKGASLFGGDFSKFDSTQSFQILDRVMDIINAWFDDGPANALIRKTLWRSVTNCVHIKGCFVYQADHSLASGNALTAIANSIYVIMVFMYCWILMFKGTPYESLECFFLYVYIITFGDDHVVNIDDLIKEFFNQKTIPPIMKSLGMNYTDENKNIDPLVAYKSITDVTFLKRGFVFDASMQRYLAPLDFGVLREMVYYIKKDAEPYYQMKNLFEFSLEQAFHHGEEVYRDWTRKVERAIIESSLPIKINYLSYSAQRRNYLAYDTDLKKVKASDELEEILVCQMYSLSDGRKVTKTNTTTFSDDVGISMATKPGAVSTPSWLSAEESDSKYLERPIKVASFPWSSANAFGSIITTLDMPDVIINNATITPKIENYRFLAADILIEIKFNSISTACGTLWMFFEPFREMILERRFANNFGCMTGYNGLELNVGSPAAMTFLIPYISPNTYHDLKNALVGLGALHFAVLAPFSTTVPTDKCTVDVFASLKNVRLCVHLPNTTISAQMEAVQKSEKGMISSISGPVTNAAKALSGLPVLGQYFQAAAWLGDCVTTVSTSIGLCKTPDLKASITTTPQPAKGFTQAYGIDQGVVLSLHPANAITPSLSVFGTSVDEMDYKYIQNKYCWFGQFNLSTSDPSGTILTYFPITPGLCAASFTPDVSGTFSTTLLSYLTSMHQLWRGGVTIRLSFAKTNYQNTRISIAVFPGFNAAEIVPGLNFDAVNKVIVDLNETSVAEITIPYQSATPWLVATLFNDATYDEANYTNCLGMLVISVETPLYVQINSPSSIVCNMWIKGADDTQFAIADFSNYYPYTTEAPPEPSSSNSALAKQRSHENVATNLSHRAPRASSRSSSSKQKVTNHAQVGDEDEAPPGSNHMEQMNPQEGIPTSSGVITADLQPYVFCIGDKCDNLRVLCKRSTRLLATNLAVYTLDPSYFGAFTTSTSNQCALNYISRIFRLTTGGRRYMFTTYGSTAGATTTLSPSYYLASQVWVYNATPYLISGPASVPTPSSFMSSNLGDLNPVMQITVPYNRLTPCALVSDQVFQTESFRPILYVQTYNKATVTGATGAPLTDLFTSGADDFSFGYLVGSPQLKSY